MNDSIKNPKRDLRQAATKLFAAEGYNAVSIDRIAASIGSTKGLFYHHYYAKVDILADIALTGWEAMREAAEAALDATDGGALAELKLEALALAELQVAFELPDAARVAAKASDILTNARLSDAHAEARDKAMGARQALERLYQNVYRDGVREGRLEPLPPRFAVWLIRLPILAATDWGAGPEGARTPADRVAEAVARFAAKGLIEPNDAA
jgi:AcrR family transcriptional regulator